MLTSAMTTLIEHQRLGFVASVCADGTPNLSPKGTFVVVDERRIAFAEIRSPGTLANLAERPVVEVNFVDPLSREGLRAKGRATAHARGTPGYRVHRSRFDRWGALADRAAHIVVIELTAVAPLSSPAYDDGATRAELRAQWSAILLHG